MDISTVKQWLLFVGFSKLSLKAVLPHNGNEYPSVPAVHAVYVMVT
jgi:hypothetical protein